MIDAQGDNQALVVPWYARIGRVFKAALKGGARQQEYLFAIGLVFRHRADRDNELHSGYLLDRHKQDLC